MLLDNFEQHLEIFILNAQHAWKSAQNKMTSLNTSKNELLKSFHGFRVLKYDLWKKPKPGNAVNLQKTF